MDTEPSKTTPETPETTENAVPEPTAPVAATTQEPVKPTYKCEILIRQGKRRGEPCGRYIMQEGSDVCLTHVKSNAYLATHPPKAVEIPAPAKTEPTPEPPAKTEPVPEPPAKKQKPEEPAVTVPEPVIPDPAPEKETKPAEPKEPEETSEDDDDEEDSDPEIEEKKEPPKQKEIVAPIPVRKEIVAPIPVPAVVPPQAPLRFSELFDKHNPLTVQEMHKRVQWVTPGTFASQYLEFNQRKA